MSKNVKWRLLRERCQRPNETMPRLNEKGWQPSSGSVTFTNICTADLSPLCPTTPLLSISNERAGVSPVFRACTTVGFKIIRLSVYLSISTGLPALQQWSQPITLYSHNTCRDEPLPEVGNLIQRLSSLPVSAADIKRRSKTDPVVIRVALCPDGMA